MKRFGYLIPQISDLKNLYHAYYKASKTKRHKKNVIDYKENLLSNILQLQKQILSGSIEIGNYTYFTIYEPKERIICAASFPERVLHHALINKTHDIFENKQIYDSYATRIGKGTYKAIERAAEFIKAQKYYLKLDVRKYFDSIDHQILKDGLKRIFKDDKLLSIFFQIIDSYTSNSVGVTKSQSVGVTQSHPDTIHSGLPIGNLTSQYFANFYLTPMDRYAKEILQTKYYIRYMDDVVVFSNDFDDLKNKSEKLQNFIEKVLNLQFKTNYINTTQHGVSFLGYRIFNNRIELNTKSKKRYIKKIKQYYENLEKGIFTEHEFQRHVLPLIAFTQKASAKGFRKKVLELSGVF